MGFVSHVLGSVSNVQMYYILGLLIFFVFFLVILYRTYKMPKADLVAFKTSILDKDEEL